MAPGMCVVAHIALACLGRRKERDRTEQKAVLSVLSEQRVIGRVDPSPARVASQVPPGFVFDTGLAQPFCHNFYLCP